MVFGLQRNYVALWWLHKLNNIRNAFDFVHFEIRKTVAFWVFVHTFRNKNIPYLRRKGYIYIFCRTCLLNFDTSWNKKYFRSEKNDFLFGVSKILRRDWVKNKNRWVRQTTVIKFCKNSIEKRFTLCMYS